MQWTTETNGERESAKSDMKMIMMVYIILESDEIDLLVTIFMFL